MTTGESYEDVRLKLKETIAADEAALERRLAAQPVSEPYMFAPPRRRFRVPQLVWGVLAVLHGAVCLVMTILSERFRREPRT